MEIKRNSKGQFIKGFLRYDMRGSNNSRWKYDKNKDFFGDLHKWLRYHYGHPTKCTFCKKLGKGKEIHYALLKGKKYERNIKNFIPLCVICHGNYDNTFIKKGERRSRKTEFKKGMTPWNKGKHTKSL